MVRPHLCVKLEKLHEMLVERWLAARRLREANRDASRFASLPPYRCTGIPFPYLCHDVSMQLSRGPANAKLPSKKAGRERGIP